MTVQSYKNHVRYDFWFHRILLSLVLALLAGSGRYLYISIRDGAPLYPPVLLFLFSIAFTMLCFLARIFALKAQDRAIRAEENLRHYVLTGKLLDARLTVKQIVALRFAHDEEFVKLADRAAAGSMTPDAIKQAIVRWKPDEHRV